MFLLDTAAAPKALCKDHQPGCEQEEQKGHGEEGRARAGEARSGEHEEEQTASHQVSTVTSLQVKLHQMQNSQTTSTRRNNTQASLSPAIGLVPPSPVLSGDCRKNNRSSNSCEVI